MDHTLDHDPAVRSAAEPQVRRVALNAPLHWLRRGAADMRRSMKPSLALGAAVAVAGWVLMALTLRATYLAPALLGGFLLVAPFAAIVLYGFSRQLERGGADDGPEAPPPWRANAESIAMFGLLLAVILIFWERIAAIIFAAFYRSEPLQVTRLLSDLVLSGQHVGLLLAFCAAGAVFAAVVFALSVVTAPLLLDRPVDIITAVLTSVRCCRRNPAPMLLWAALIAGITAVGLATFMLGLVVAFPWLAHASWHAYRDLVDVR